MKISRKSYKILAIIMYSFASFNFIFGFIITTFFRYDGWMPMIIGTICLVAGWLNAFQIRLKENETP